MKCFIVFLAFFAMASAVSFDENQAEERIFTSLMSSTDGYTYLGLNQTSLWVLVVVGALVGVLALILSSGAPLVAAKRIQSYGQEFSEDIFYPEEEETQTRYKRFAFDNGKSIFHSTCINIRDFFQRSTKLNIA